MTVARAPKWIRSQPRGGDTTEEELAKLRRERESIDRLETLHARVRGGAFEGLDELMDVVIYPPKSSVPARDMRPVCGPRKGPFGRTQPEPSKRTLPSDAHELARLADGSPQHWHSPIRDRLISEGYVEVTYQPDGRWGGDRITPAGRARLLMTKP